MVVNKLNRNPKERRKKKKKNMSCDTQLLFVEKMDFFYHIYNLQWLGSTVNEH